MGRLLSIGQWLQMLRDVPGRIPHALLMVGQSSVLENSDA
jgi:hypothetical protein